MMSCCWNHCGCKRRFLCACFITEIFPTNIASPILSISCFCTGGCFAVCLIQLMPGGRNHCGCKRRFLCACFITEIFFTNTAIPVFCISCFCTGSCFAIRLIQLMSCWNCCISKQYFLSSFAITKILSANRTIPVLYVSCFCAGGCFAVCLA